MMLRCRKCRKMVADSTCLFPEVEEAAVCSIYHLDMESVPDWIYSTVERAQWTMGKLNCLTCNARLGGFNFVHRSLCPCGIDTSVHLSKSRVDSEHPHRAVIFYPRTAQTGWTSRTTCAGGEERQETGWTSGTTCAGGKERQETKWTSATTCAGSQDRQETGWTSRTMCAGGKERQETGWTSRTMCAEGEERQETGWTSRTMCAGGKERQETGWTSRTMCAGGQDRQETGRTSGAKCAGGEERQETRWTSRTTCAGAEDLSLLQGFTDSRAHNTDMISPEELSSIKALSKNLAAQHFGARKDHVTSGFCVAEDSHLPCNDTVDLTEVLRGPQCPANTTENPEDLPPSHVPQQLNRKEKNRLKSLRRKERKRERWLHCQQEKEQANVSESEGSREGLMCAVCLDVYYSPLCCQPCQHVFCEPCLRTLAKNRTSSTACPLCRTIICHTSPHEELSKSVKTFFPKAYSARKQSFQNAPCSKWPLPRSNRHLHMLWGHHRSTASWTPSLLSMETLHLNNMANRGSWLSDIALVIVCFHSVYWVLAALLFSLFCYYLFC